MSHIKRFDEYVNEMARYSRSFSEPFRSFTDRIRRFNYNYKYVGNVIANPYLEGKNCAILPFVNEVERTLLPVLVWRDKGGKRNPNGYVEYAIGYDEFVGNVEEVVGPYIDLEDALDALGGEYEYDVKVVIKDIAYNPKDNKMNDFISHAFDNYDLHDYKADTNPSVDKIVYKP